MFKLFGWFGKAILIGIIAAAISAVTTFYVLNVYVQEIMKPVQEVLPIPSMQFSEFVAKLWNGSNIVGQGGTSQTGKESTTRTRTQTQSQTQSQSQPQSLPNESASTQSPKDDDAVAAWAQSGSGAAREKDKVVMSEEQFLAKRNQLSEEDKANVFSLLSRLPQEALLHISTMLEDGLTAAEIQEIEKIVEQYLKPDELAKLMEIVNKY